MGRLVKAMGVDELPAGSMKTVDVEGRPVLVANVGGVFYAMDALCSHEEWDLSEGVLEGVKVTCAGHGAVWDLTKGGGRVRRGAAETECLQDTCQGRLCVCRGGLGTRRYRFVCRECGG